jgi:YD repeat-containing protein
MSDLANWKVHGPVHTLRTEFAEWDLSLEQWKPPHNPTLAWFDPGGHVSEQEHHNPDGSIVRFRYSYDAAGRIVEGRSETSGTPGGKTIYLYDANGLLARVVGVDPDGKESDAQVYSCGPRGKRTCVHMVPKQEPNGLFTAIMIRPEVRDQVDEVLLKDQDQTQVRRIVFTRDSAGRLASEEVQLGEKDFESLPSEDREKTRVLIARLLGPQKIVSSTTYSYDEKGRVAERRIRMGELSSDRTIYRYDDHDNPIEEIHEHTARDLGIDDAGNSCTAKESSHTQTSHMEYKYDAQGNWTERIVLGRLEPNPNFERSNVERREITYYAPTR